MNNPYFHHFHPHLHQFLQPEVHYAQHDPVQYVQNAQTIVHRRSSERHHRHPQLLQFQDANGRRINVLWYPNFNGRGTENQSFNRPKMDLYLRPQNVVSTQTKNSSDSENGREGRGGGGGGGGGRFIQG